MLAKIDRYEAHRRGLVHFYTGRACKRGHDAQRYVSTGACVDCVYLKRHNIPQAPNVIIEDKPFIFDAVGFYSYPVPLAMEILHKLAQQAYDWAKWELDRQHMEANSSPGDPFPMPPPIVWPKP